MKTDRNMSTNKTVTKYVHTSKYDRKPKTIKICQSEYQEWEKPALMYSLSS